MRTRVADRIGYEVLEEESGAWVDWHGPRGTFIPRCNLCDYAGKPQDIHGAARAAVRQHIATVSHRLALRSKVKA